MCWYVTVQNSLLWAEWQGFDYREGKFFHHHHLGLCHTYSPTQWLPGTASSDVRRWSMKLIDHSYASRAKVWNMWSFTSMFHIHHLGIAVGHL
jgi:hypothetical protein